VTVTGGPTDTIVINDPEREVVKVTVIPGRTWVSVKVSLSVFVVAETCVTVIGGTTEVTVVKEPEIDVVRVTVVPGIV